MTPELVDYLKTLVPPPAHFQGTGALRLTPDPRDYHVTQYPCVAEMLQVGTPDSASLLQDVKGSPLDQNGTGACVAASTSHASSVDAVTEFGRWDVMDWRSLYAQAGGTGQNGVDSRLVLDICSKQGTPLQAGGREVVIKSYAFVTQTPGAFREEIKACIAAGQPAVIALLLPSDFGWQSGQPNAQVTSGYHQVCCVAYDQAYAIILNSWGSGWPGAGSPGPGIGSIRWDYLEANGLQHGYCFAYTTAGGGTPAPTPAPTPTPTPTPAPPPPPIQSRSLTGQISGAGVSTLSPGQTLSVTAGSFAGNLQVTGLGDLPEPSPTPAPTPSPGPSPGPAPGDLTVRLATRRVGSYEVVWAQAVDANGGFVQGTAQGTAGAVVLPPKPCSQTPAVWQVQGAAGSVIVTVTDNQGRTGQAEGSV